ncbi:MAG: hypothetical protein VX291_01210 [Gemmatimonadota bacterium]|nr:hypothetical protein [Gemmatimonadota bacterium]MEE3136528.1 hypothetical protein [Gemmatimonadota bacterium]
MTIALGKSGIQATHLVQAGVLLVQGANRCELIRPSDSTGCHRDVAPHPVLLSVIPTSIVARSNPLATRS